MLRLTCLNTTHLSHAKIDIFLHAKTKVRTMMHVSHAENQRGARPHCIRATCLTNARHVETNIFTTTNASHAENIIIYSSSVGGFEDRLHVRQKRALSVRCGS
jgi:hypothetical protein